MTDESPAHSDIMGGSTAAQRINCPGSYKLEQTISKQPESDYAKEGSALHAAMEHILLVMGENPCLYDLIGEVFGGVCMTANHIDSKLRPALDAFKEICALYPGELDFMVEVKGSLDSVMKGTFGTVDILGKFKNGPTLVLDWKFGDGVPVSVEGNMQLGFYAGCALYSEDEEVKEMLEGDSTDIVFAIVQPRRGHDGQCYEVWNTTDDWVEDFLDLAEKGYNLAVGDNAPIKSGSHCRWCRASINCPTKQKIIGEAKTLSPKSMDAVALSRALDTAEELDSWVKAVRLLARAELDGGAGIPGWKLVPKRASRVYTDIKKATGVLVRQLKTEEAHIPREIISPAQAEIKLGKKTYSKLLSKHVTMFSSGNTMARDSDSRPDVSDTLAKLADVDKNAKGTLFDN